MFTYTEHPIRSLLVLVVAVMIALVALKLLSVWRIRRMLRRPSNQENYVRNIGESNRKGGPAVLRQTSADDLALVPVSLKPNVTGGSAIWPYGRAGSRDDCN